MASKIKNKREDTNRWVYSFIKLNPEYGDSLYLEKLFKYCQKAKNILIQRVVGECTVYNRNHVVRQANKLIKDNKKAEAKLLYTQIKEILPRYKNKDITVLRNKHMSWAQHVPSQVFHCIAVEVYQYITTHKIYSKWKQAKKDGKRKIKYIKFMSRKNPLTSLSSGNLQTIKVDFSNNYVIIPRKKKIAFGVPSHHYFDYVKNNQNKITIAQLVRKKTLQGFDYFIYLTIEGKPPRQDNIGKDILGIDINAEHIDIINRNTGEHTKLFYVDREQFTRKTNYIKNLQRKLEELQRLHNPASFNDGGYIKGSKVIYTKSMIKIKNKITVESHNLMVWKHNELGKTANKVMELGSNLYFEKTPLDEWKTKYKQKNKNVRKLAQNNSIGRFIEFLKKKSNSVEELNTYTTKCTQTCPGCGDIAKKGNSKIHLCEKCGLQLDRHVASAINIASYDPQKKTLDLVVSNDILNKYLGLSNTHSVKAEKTVGLV